MVVNPGYYRLSQPVKFWQPKVIHMGHPLLQPYDNDPRRRPNRGPGPLLPDSHVRIWTDSDIPHLFEVYSPEVYGFGGTFDLQKHPADKDVACIFYPGDIVDHNNRANCWGGGFLNSYFIGNYLALGRAEGNGHYGVLMDFGTEPLLNSYYTHVDFSAKARGLKCVWKSTPRNPEFSQWANTVTISIEAGQCKQAMSNEAFAGLVSCNVRHQAAPVYASETEMESTDSVFSLQVIHLNEPLFFDFDKPPEDVTGNGDIWWRNKYSINVPEGWTFSGNGYTAMLSARVRNFSQPFWSGKGYLWVDSSGIVRVNLKPYPPSPETDGTPIN